MTRILSAQDFLRMLRRLAHEVVEANQGASDLVIMGIQSRGVPLARRLADLIGEIEGETPPVGELDVTLYRDDLRDRGPLPLGRTEFPVNIDGKVVVLVDDVLYTGRTIRAAMDAVFEVGRPRAIRLVVLVDRGHRQLPVRADHVGKNLPTAFADHVTVKVAEFDGEDAVIASPKVDGEDRA